MLIFRFEQNPVKCLLAIIFIFSILFVPCAAIAEDAIDYRVGFRDIQWGAALSSLEGRLVKSKNKIPPFKGYEMPNENLSWEGITANSITYGFKNGKFGGLNIGFAKKDFETVLKAFTGKFGSPKKTELFIMTNYEWHTGELDISLISTSKGGSLNIKPK
jgi:hypothetical protein